MKEKTLKIASIVAILAGSVGLYVAGVGGSTVVALIAGVFVLAGVIASMFKLELKA